MKSSHPSRLAGRVAIILLFALTACSSPSSSTAASSSSAVDSQGTNRASMITFPAPHKKRIHPLASSSDFQWVATWSKPGKQAEADCPTNWVLIAGGTNNTDGGGGGIGTPNSARTGWITSNDGSNTVEAFASCADPSLASYFKWVDASGTLPVKAQCPSGWEVIMGYGNTHGSYPDFSAREWVGIITGSQAHASCVDLDVGDPYGYSISQVWGVTNSFASCNDTGPPNGTQWTLLGGSDGDSQYWGPPENVEHPDIKTATWRVYGPNDQVSGGENVLSTAACLPTST